MMKVNLEDLEPSEDYALLEYQGLPFTGVAIESDGANQIVEISFRDGMRSGPTRHLTPGGQIMCEENYESNALDGTLREWYPSGILRRSAQYELGICLKETLWSDQGSIMQQWDLDEKSPQFETLRLLRSGKKC